MTKVIRKMVYEYASKKTGIKYMLYVANVRREEIEEFEKNVEGKIFFDSELEKQNPIVNIYFFSSKEPKKGLRAELPMYLKVLEDESGVPYLKDEETQKT